MSDSSKNYKYVLEQEVLKEVACGLMANLLRYIEYKGFTLSDKKQDIVVLYWQISEIKHNIVDTQNNDNEKLAMIKGYLMYIRDYIDMLNCEERL
jgi:hypothetical protein